MKKDDTENVTPSDELLAELFENLTPRSRPRIEAQNRAFNILLPQWRELTDRRRTRIRIMTWSLAATLFLSVGLVFNWLAQSHQSELGPVAVVARTTGSSIYANSSVIDSAPGGFPPFSIGDTLTTGPNSRIALEWNSGGSLRIKENSEIQFISPESIRLVSGSVYFDSSPFDGIASDTPTFSIETVAGKVSHVGTQFLTTIQDIDVTIVVREGEVLVDGPVFNYLAQPKDELKITANGLRSKQKVEPFDATWEWTEQIAPYFNPDGKTAQELAVWIGRETGRRILYRSSEVEESAGNTLLIGLDNLDPMQALRTIPIATDLRYDIVNEEIVIGLNDEIR